MSRRVRSRANCRWRGFTLVELPAVSKRGFTLVELLAVIAILGILLMVTVPAFNKIGKGTGMTAAITEVRTTCMLARQWAVTHRQETYVLFPDQPAAEDGADVSKAYRAYAVFAVTNRTSRQGYYVKGWDYLPPGIVLDVTETLPGNVFNEIVNLPFPSADSPFVDVPALKFKTDGTIGGVGGAGCAVYFGEGWTSVNEGTGTLEEYDFRSTARTILQIAGMTGATTVTNRY